VRNTATLYVKIGGAWKIVYTVTLSGNSKVAFAASAGTHEFTNIKVSAVKELDSVAQLPVRPKTHLLPQDIPRPPDIFHG